MTSLELGDIEFALTEPGEEVLEVASKPFLTEFAGLDKGNLLAAHFDGLERVL